MKLNLAFLTSHGLVAVVATAAAMASSSLSTGYHWVAVLVASVRRVGCRNFAGFGKNPKRSRPVAADVDATATNDRFLRDP